MNNQVKQQKIKIMAVSGGIIALHLAGVLMLMIVGMAMVSLLGAGISLLYSDAPFQQNVRYVFHWFKWKGTGS